jgi:catechol-2,3-dioxygenase
MNSTCTKRWKMKNLKITSKIFKAMVFISSGHYHERLITNSMVGINFLLVKKMGDLYRFDVAESKYGNQIASSPTIFEREALKVTKIHL